MFDYFKKKAIIDRSNDELLYEYVLEELESNIKIRLNSKNGGLKTSSKYGTMGRK